MRGWTRDFHLLAQAQSLLDWIGISPACRARTAISASGRRLPDTAWNANDFTAGRPRVVDIGLTLNSHANSRGWLKRNIGARGVR